MKLAFHVDQSSGAFHPGDILSGNLVIKANKTVAASQLAIYLRAKEDTMVEYKNVTKHRESLGGSKTNHHFRKSAHGSRQIMRLNIFNSKEDPMQQPILQNGKILPGTYQIPFRIRVPYGVPSSMEVQMEHNSATVSYSLRAVLVTSQKECQGRYPIQVLAAPELLPMTPPISCRMPPYTQRITSCGGFCTRGHVTIAVKIVNTHLVRGQTVLVRVAMVNESVAPLDRIAVQLRQVMWWTADEHDATFTKVLSTQLVPIHHEKMDTQELRKRQRMKADVGQHHNTPQGLWQVLDDSTPQSQDQQPYFCSLPIPVDANDTFQSVHIKVTHEIQIKPLYSIRTAQPEFHFPVKIVQRGPKQPAATGEKETKSMKETPKQTEQTPTINREHTNQLPSMDLLRPPSVDHLLERMIDSVDDLAMVQLRVRRPEWQPIFASLSPTDFGRILQVVHLTVNQIPVALTLAARVDRDLFSCQHVMKALAQCSDEYGRSDMIEQLIPYCCDVKNDRAKQLLINHLSDWEIMATKTATRRYSLHKM